MLAGLCRMGLTMRLILVAVVALTIGSFYSTFVNQTPKEALAPRSDFSWMSYLDQNDGLPQNTYQYAIKNYEHGGRRKGRPYLQISPPVSEIENLHKKINTFTTACPSRKHNPQTHNLAIYRITDAEADILPVLKLNLLMFLSTIEENPCISSVPTFYVFSVSSARRHTLTEFIPNKPNIVILNWVQKNVGDHLYNHLRTLEVINAHYLTQFSAVFLLNIHTRGPLIDRDHGDWIKTYRRLLDNNNIGMVGHVECGETKSHKPVLQTQTLALRVPYVLSVLQQFKIAKYTPVDIEQRFDCVLQRWFGMNDDALIHTTKYKIASITHYYMDNKHTIYKNECDVKPTTTSQAKSHTKQYTKMLDHTPTINCNHYAHNAWCNNITQRVFIPWTAVNVHDTEYTCPNRINFMTSFLTQFTTLYPQHAKYIQSNMVIDVNEVLNTDVFREVFVQYTEEQKRLHYVRRAFNNTNVDTSNYPYKIVAGSGVGSVHNMNHTHTTPYMSVTHYAPYTYTNRINSQVCFLVRTSTMHDRIQYVDKGAHFVESTVYDFITSLQKQTNPNWRAYLFLTDNRPFGDRLKSIVLGAADSRVVYFEVDSAYRPAFTKVDGGYTATDHVLHHTLRNDHTCKYITVTNADNWYGSEVVQGVLGYGVSTYGGGSSSGASGGSGGSGSTTSGSTLSGSTTSGSGSGASGGSGSTTSGSGSGGSNEGSAGGGEAPPMLLAPLDSRNFNIDYFTRGPNRATHDEGCRAFNSLLQQNSLVYTVQPLPRVSKIDLASMFLNRERLLAENVLFANFTDPLTYPCLGCQDGYLAEYLSKTQGWGHGRMAIDGLKSVVFHGPAPTLCVAMGNVWFDHPAVNKVGCYPRSTAHSLRMRDLALRTQQYDWAHFDTSLGVCLRLSSAAFSKLDKQDVLIVGKKVNKRGQSLLNLLNWT